MRIFSAQIAPASASLADAIRCRPDVGKETFARDAFEYSHWETPVLVSHIDGFVAGKVIARTAVHGWHQADFVLDEKYGAWVTIGTPVSIRYLPLRVEREFAGTERVTRAKLVELSVLGPGERPFYRDAKVTSILGARNPEPQKPQQPSLRAIRGNRSAEMAEFDRRVDAAGPNADPELILETLREELGYTLPGQWQRRAA
jgi:hypothetical protein